MFRTLPIALGALTLASISLFSEATPLPANFTEQHLLAIAPTTGSCQGATYPEECAVAKDAAPLLDEAFKRYGLETAEEAGAALAWMLNESGGFKYNMNHFSASGGHNPGQGTRCMANFPFLTAYASTFPELSGNLTAIDGRLTPNITSAAVPADFDPAKKDAVLDLVLGPEYTFGSAVWFYSGCPQATKDAVKTGNVQAFLQDCVHGPSPQILLDYFGKTVQVLGGASGA